MIKHSNSDYIIGWVPLCLFYQHYKSQLPSLHYANSNPMVSFSNHLVRTIAG